MNLEKLNLFVATHTGQPVDFDGQFGAQCVDLVRQYWYEVDDLIRQPEGVTGAADFANHNSRPIQKALLDWTDYTVGARPPPGAAVVFKRDKANGNYGHVAVCIEADDKQIKAFEQDGVANLAAVKAGRPQKGAYINTWDYRLVLGWLTKKGER